MTRLGRLAVQRPKAVLAGWLTVFGILALLGLGVEHRLHRTDLRIPGSGADRASALADRSFGRGQTLSVLLEGPPQTLAARGPRIAAALERRPGVDVLSPWSGGPAARNLRPAPGRALLVLRLTSDYDQASESVIPGLRKTLADAVDPPLRSHLTGFADIGRGIERASLSALTRAELIAAPLLLLILLLVFRTPIAAGVPLLIGMTTIGASRGLLSLMNATVVPLDAIALNLASMMGLALGVDYSLLMVSRFREELHAGASPDEAARIAMGTAGRTVRFAGLALMAATVGAYAVAPGSIFASASAGIMAGVVLSVIAAGTGLPAVLALLGRRLDGGRRDREGSRWGALAWRAIRRPAVAGGLVLLLLGALALPAAGMQSGPPDPRMLPASSVERQDFEAVGRALGSGWSAPYEIIVSARQGTITEPRRMAALSRWQRSLAADRRVHAVLGPGAIYARTAPLRAAPARLAGAGDAVRAGRHAQARIAGGLRRVHDGVGQVDDGLAQAAAGATALAGGTTRLADGVAPLRSGLAKAQRGAGALAAGARRALVGARRLAAALRGARATAASGVPDIERLAAGLDDGARGLTALREPAQLSERELRAAQQALDGMLPTSKADPGYAAAYRHVATALAAVSGRNPLSGARVRAGYDGLDAGLAQAATGAQTAAGGVRSLLRATRRAADGLERLATGAGELARGLARLRAGADRLTGGTGELTAGGARLDAAIGQLGGGARRMADGLAGGRPRVHALGDGVGRLQAGVQRLRRRTGQLAHGLDQARRLTPALRSGFFALAALDSAPQGERRAASYAVNIDHGGNAARIVVVEATDPTQSGDPLRARLERDADRLQHETGMDVAVGGAAASLQDFDAATSSRLPLLVLVLMVLTYVVLVPVLRSVVLPLLAVVLNVLTVAAAFGVLVLCFQGHAPPLGGPGFIDAMMVMGVFSVCFGLSIDYEVFLLARMREGWERTGDTSAAIRHGLDRTAAVITGAALIMTAVFVAFAMADVINMREYGIGLTIAVILDATLVRLVLLPAAIRLAGRAAWWMPRWLDRLLPDVAVEAPEPASAPVTAPRFVRDPEPALAEVGRAR
jgi:RND superfamily putative drug exporter